MAVCPHTGCSTSLSLFPHQGQQGLPLATAERGNIPSASKCAAHSRCSVSGGWCHRGVTGWSLQSTLSPGSCWGGRGTGSAKGRAGPGSHSRAGLQGPLRSGWGSPHPQPRLSGELLTAGLGARPPASWVDSASRRTHPSPWPLDGSPRSHPLCAIGAGGAGHQTSPEAGGWRRPHPNSSQGGQILMGLWDRNDPTIMSKTASSSPPGAWWLLQI